MREWLARGPAHEMKPQACREFMYIKYMHLLGFGLRVYRIQGFGFRVWGSIGFWVEGL